MDLIMTIKYDNSTTANDDGSLRAVRLDELALDTFFKRKPDANKVYARGEYDRTDKRYSCSDVDDISRYVYLKGSTIVYIGFEY